MKPHLRLWQGIWSCVSVEPVAPMCDRIVSGYGYSWRQAWDEWKRERAAK